MRLLQKQIGRRVWTLAVKWEPRDVWIGLYWEGGKVEAIHTVAYRFFLCLIPLFPLILTMQRTYNADEWAAHLKKDSL